MKKFILIATAVVILLGGGIGGTFMYLSVHRAAAAHKALLPPPKSIYFAQLADLVITVPADTGDSTSTYVQITLQFSSFDPNAVTSFDNLQPIIRSQVIALLMSKTAKSLMDPSTHEDLSKSCLTIANQVLNKSANYTPPSPFTAAYITNLVEQN
jgi:flagellar basal body-associated protein FliL